MLSCSWCFLCILDVSAASAHPPGAGALCTPLLLHTRVLAQLTSSSFHLDLVAPPIVELCTCQPLSEPHRHLQRAPAGGPPGNFGVALSFGGTVALPSKGRRSLSEGPLGAAQQPAVPER